MSDLYGETAEQGVSRHHELLRRWRADADLVPPCAARDVRVTVRWERVRRGLRGEVVVENVGDRACLLNLKPTVIPLARDGKPLQTMGTNTLKLRLPAHVVLEPGKRAVATLSWLSWCGERAGRRALVQWWEGSAVADVEGPVQPECRHDRSGNLKTSWFDSVD